MKYYIFLFFLFFIGKIFAQIESNIGIINDADGYTNIRKEASTKSQIIGRILKNEYFFYEEYNSRWCKITKQDNTKGFIHKSRILKVNSEKLLSIRVNNDSSEDEVDRNIIVDYTTLNEDNQVSYFFMEYNYPLIKQNESKNNYILFKEDSIYVKFSVKNVNTKDYVIKKNKYGEDIINNEKTYGLLGDGTPPKKEIDNICISINGKKEYNLPKSVYKYLFEPTLESVKVYKKEKNQLIIYMSGADASASYETIFIVNEKQLLKRYIYRNF